MENVKEQRKKGVNIMKTAVLGLLIVGLACSASALDRNQLNDRIRSLTAQFTSMEQNPATRIPADQLARAHGIVLLDRTKGAFIFGYHSGYGVALAKGPAGHWGPAGFVSSTGASLGAQIGGTKDFFVVLLMSPAAADALKQPVDNFGAQASETGWNQHAGAKAMSNSRQPVVVYSEHNGVYAGASIKGGSVSADKDANSTYYGRTVSMNGILFGHQVSPTPVEDQLISKVNEFSR